MRFLQEYFLCACSIHDIVRRFRGANGNWNELPDKVAIQLNDTHPTVSIAELMRLLLDENMPEPVVPDLVGHEVSHVIGLGWSGIKNGALLKMAEQAGFGVLLTLDKGIPSENRMDGRKIAVFVLRPDGQGVRALWVRSSSLWTKLPQAKSEFSRTERVRDARWVRRPSEASGTRPGRTNYVAGIKL